MVDQLVTAEPRGFGAVGQSNTPAGSSCGRLWRSWAPQARTAKPFSIHLSSPMVGGGSLRLAESLESVEEQVQRKLELELVVTTWANDGLSFV